MNMTQGKVLTVYTQQLRFLLWQNNEKLDYCTSLALEAKVDHMGNSLTQWNFEIIKRNKYWKNGGCGGEARRRVSANHSSN